MKAHQILGIVWLLLCGFFVLNMLAVFFHLYSAHKLGATWAVCAAAFAFLLYFIGIAASIFLFRGALWARKYIGAIAALSIVGCIGRLVVTGSLPGLLCLETVFSLVTIFILFYPKRNAA